MPGVEAIRARAFIAEYYRESGDFKKALKYRKVAIKQYKPKYGQKSPEMNDIYSAMVFNAVHGSYDQYMRTKLTGKIDNNIVARKAKLLENLENGYTSVISGQSPAWVLKACYYSYEVNREFAVFLKESPLPDGLTADQKTQYKGLIAQQAKAYDDKAAEYLKTCKNQAVKWEIIDPDVMRLIVDEDIDSGGFGGQSSVSEIAEQFLKDEELKNLHYEVFHQPENIDLLMKLAGMYYDRTDYYQAQLLAWKVVDHNDAGSSMKAKAYKLIGISNLYTGNDTKARDAFKKALELNPGDVEATINLAGILKHYKQTSAAEKLYSDLPEALDINAGTSIHPVAKEMYYAHVKS